MTIASATMVIFLAFTACNDSKTAQELLKEEKKAISRFISQHNYKILSEYPKDHAFGPNEFYKEPNGLYIQVVDSGNGIKPRGGQTVIARYNSKLYFKTDTTKFTPAKNMVGGQPDEFQYGIRSSYGAITPNIDYEANSCIAWEIALSYVSDRAKVNLIIPSELGTTYGNQNYLPVYHEGVVFKLE